ncbi:MAG: Maf family nucleotide pyrophosphatase [Bacteroidota bacterium]
MLQLKYPLILASKSPRRKELLSNTGLQFSIYTMEVEESFPEQMPVREVAEFLAKKKGKAYLKEFPDSLIITADTTVVVDNVVLNKPTDYEEARKMILQLKDRKHEVITGVCITSPSETISFSESTAVTFGPLSDEEISYYINQYKPFDKAGAYGIQEWIGLIGIEKIEGSYYNVVGLPVRRIYQYLKNFTS